jgi:hypothetical protein
LNKPGEVKLARYAFYVWWGALGMAARARPCLKRLAQNVAAWASFVADVHLHIFAVLSAQFGENLFHGMKIIADLSVGPHFALSASFGNGDGDRLFMDIQSDGEYWFYWCV